MEALIRGCPLPSRDAIRGPIHDERQQLLDEHALATTPHLSRYGCKVNSQNGEDGILYYIFHCIGTTNKVTFELCAGDGIECNSANLILHHGFRGFLVDGHAPSIRAGITFYTDKAKADPSIHERVTFIQTWLTAENAASLVERFSVPKECDLLIMDIDGNDYWVLKALMESGMRPRVICVEYQDIIGPDAALTIPYDPEFNHQRYDCWQGPNYCGASLRAFIQLLQLDYAFVGCEGLGFNGFFVRRDQLANAVPGSLKEMTDIRPCFDIPKVQFGMQERWPRSAHMPWVNVD